MKMKNEKSEKPRRSGKKMQSVKAAKSSEKNILSNDSSISSKINDIQNAIRFNKRYRFRSANNQHTKLINIYKFIYYRPKGIADYGVDEYVEEYF